MAGARDPHPEREKVLELLQRYGWNAASFQVLEPDFRYWFADPDACVAYVDTGSAWVAAGAPLAPPERLESVALGFIAAARATRRRPLFFGAESRFAQAVPLRRVQVGEQPVWEPSQWKAILDERRSLREQLRRARARGVTVRRVAPEELADESSPIRREVEQLLQRWLESRPMAPMGFLVQLHLFGFVEERRCFVAERDGRAVAFLNAVPVYGRNGWFLEDLLRAPEAPNGSTELLIDAAMKAAGQEGVEYVTLGLAPLAGPVTGWLRLARRLGAALYDFEGLRTFKAKLRPSRWDPIYLCHPKGPAGLLAIYDTLRAFARGHLLRFGVRTLLHSPALVLRAMAILLVPWTVLLATADPSWFPSRGVQWGWVTFDAALAPALYALTGRWRRWLGTLLALAVSGDAVLTLVQALTYNVPRARGALDAAVIGASLAAPSFAAFLLWRLRPAPSVASPGAATPRDVRR